MNIDNARGRGFRRVTGSGRQVHYIRRDTTHDTSGFFLLVAMSVSLMETLAILLLLAVSGAVNVVFIFRNYNRYSPEF